MARTLMTGFVAVSLLALTGCPTVQPENEVTWGVKAATGKLTETTSKEWQSVVSVANDLVEEVDIEITEEQGQAIVDFIVANDLDSLEEIGALVEQVQADPSTAEDIQIPPSVEELFTEQFEGVLDQIARDAVE